MDHPFAAAYDFTILLSSLCFQASHPAWQRKLAEIRYTYAYKTIKPFGVGKS
jgi:hypothetical protein